MIELKDYDAKYEKQWDEFVLHNSLNGTFLQTRNFLNYHPEGRFSDSSLLFMKGNTIVAVIPANLILDNGKKILMSHQASTFGGIILGKQYKKLSVCEEIFNLLDEYAVENQIGKIILKYTSRLFSKSDSELLDYFAFLNGYSQYSEMGYYVDFEYYEDDIVSNLASAKRRGYKSSLKDDLEFRPLMDSNSVKMFYDVLCDNYRKFDKNPVHTCDELIEFMQERLPDRVRFYGVMQGEEMIAGSMVFFLRVFSTRSILQGD